MTIFKLALISRMKRLSDHDFILELAKIFRQAHREGAAEDVPEGARYITISDTLAGMIAGRLEAIVAEVSDD